MGDVLRLTSSLSSRGNKVEIIHNDWWECNDI